MSCFKKIVLLSSIIFSFIGNNYSQKTEDTNSKRNDSLRKENRKMAISDLFYNQNSDGLYYLGLTNSYEISTYYLGGEIKLYDSYYTPFLGVSFYANFRAPIFHFSEVKHLNIFSIGGSFSIIGFEMTTYFNENESIYYLTPKVGFDYGSWNIFYGFNFPIHQSEFQGINRHSVSVKYFLYLSTFKYYQMRKKSYGL